MIASAQPMRGQFYRLAEAQNEQRLGSSLHCLCRGNAFGMVSIRYAEIIGSAIKVDFCKVTVYASAEGTLA
ncbi:MAG: hypothetical protein AAFX01_04745 [Cyanobacteria bacterium J06638_28]